MMNSEELRTKFAVLLKRSGISESDFSIQQATHGGNNRIYKIEMNGAHYAVKQYFREAADKRDRLGSEFAFLSYANQVASDFVPKAFDKDDESGLALYEYVPGNRLQTNDISKKEIDSAIQFFCALNKMEVKSKASHLPWASEVSFSVNGQLELINARIMALKEAIENNSENKYATHFISQLYFYWKELVTKIKRCGQIDLDFELDVKNRCISPSDFGFHNALKTTDERIRFIDFEYAGWDDPARMVGDFFSQLAVPIHADYFDYFTQSVMQAFPETEKLIQRAKILRDVYRIKWCCIAMNVFIPVNLSRRKFANPDLNTMELKATQLKKAENLLQTVIDISV